MSAKPDIFEMMVSVSSEEADTFECAITVVVVTMTEVICMGTNWKNICDPGRR